MKDFALKIFWDWLGSHKISLAVIVAIWLMLSPSYNNLIQFQTKTEAKFDYYEQELRQSIIFNQRIEEKINLLMIESGISKSKIESIEKQSYKPQEK